MITVTRIWKPVAERPDSDTTVLLFDATVSEPVWPGYLDGVPGVMPMACLRHPLVMLIFRLVQTSKHRERLSFSTRLQTMQPRFAPSEEKLARGCGGRLRL